MQGRFTNAIVHMTACAELTLLSKACYNVIYESVPEDFMCLGIASRTNKVGFQQ